MHFSILSGPFKQTWVGGLGGHMGWGQQAAISHLTNEAEKIKINGTMSSSSFVITLMCMVF